MMKTFGSAGASEGSVRYIKHAFDATNRTLSFSIEKTELPTLKDNQVLMKVKAIGINRADLLQARGMYDPPKGESTILGLEAVGELVDPSTLAPISGNKLYGALVAGGSYVDYMPVTKSHTFEIPQGLSLEHAATIPEMWLTAYALSCKIGQVKQGQNVYINAGASSIGAALTQICAKLFKCNVYVSVSSQDKLNKCLSLGAKGGKLRTVERTQEVETAEINKFTDGKLFDLVLDCVGPSETPFITNYITTGGKWVLYGLLSGNTLSNSTILGSVLRKRIRLEGFTLRAQPSEFKTDLITGLQTDILPRIVDGTLSLDLDSSYSMDLSTPESSKVMETIFTRMGSNENSGKMVVLIK